MTYNLPHRDLSVRLGDYSAIQRYSSDKRGSDTTRRRRLAHWPFYAAVTSSALAMATNASASLIANPGINVNVRVPSISALPGYYTNFGAWHPPHTRKSATFHLTNGAGKNMGVSFHVGIDQSSAGGFQVGAAFLGAGANVRGLLVNPGTGLVKNLSAGSRARMSSGGALNGTFLHGADLVSQRLEGSLGFRPGFNALNPGGGNQGVAKLIPGQTGYAGFSFSYNHHLDYGWLKLKYTDGSNNLVHTLTVESAEFYDPTLGTSSSSPAAPEPSTGALALLAAGAAGVAALRRRRQRTQN